MSICLLVLRINEDAREDEMEDNIGQVSSMIDNLRHMAMDMGSELDSQNRQISRIDAKVCDAIRTRLNKPLSPFVEVTIGYNISVGVDTL